MRLEREGICRYCGEVVANGVGGQGDLLTPLLHSLPSSHVFRQAANVHDVSYHQGILSRKDCDKLFLKIMLQDAKGSLWLKAMAYRNYVAVRLFGARFYNKTGCPPKKKGVSYALRKETEETSA